MAGGVHAPRPRAVQVRVDELAADQGCTYAREDYQDVLDARGIVCSMSRRGNCYDNAVMESFFSTIKHGPADLFATHGDARRELLDYIEVFYNQRPRHTMIGRITGVTPW